VIRVLTVENDIICNLFLFGTNRTFCVSTETVATAKETTTTTTTTKSNIIIICRKIKTTYNLENHAGL